MFLKTSGIWKKKEKKEGRETTDKGCRWSVKSSALPFSRVMLHPPPSFLHLSSCASDRLCVGVHERKRKRGSYGEKKLLFM